MRAAEGLVVRWSGRGAARWAVRCGLVAVVASSVGAVPVVGATAVPKPVTPTAETIEVPAVDDAASPSPTSSASPSSTSSASPGLAAVGPAAVEPAEQLATGPVRTDDFNMVSVQWQGDPEADVAVQVRVRSDDGWSGWQTLPVEDSAPDPGTQEAAQSNHQGGTSPLWVSGGADAVDVRVQVPDSPGSSGDSATGDTEPAVADVRASLVDPGTSAAPASAPLASAHAAIAPMPNVITRAQWGADESLRLGSCSEPSYTSTPKVAFVHHTAGSNDYTKAESAAIVRGVYYQHVVVQGWCDIGYNFLVDKYGQIFEGRYGGMDKAVQGAHAAGFNTASFGVSVLGNYDTAKPSSAAFEALASVVAWKFGLSQTDPRGRTTLVSAGIGGTNTKYASGTAVALNAISGHRDVGSTACPGANLYSQLGALRTRVAALMQEKQWELRDSSTPGASDTVVYYGSPGDQTLACDWDGDGVDGTAVYSRGRWLVRQEAGTGGPDLSFSYGSASMVPVCGDWDGDGVAGIGVYEPATATWWLRETPSAGEPDRRFSYGFKGVEPVVGDWSGSGHDGIGVYDGYRWWLRGTATTGGAGAVFSYGWPAATPVTGDWDGDGADSVGVYSRGSWWLRDSITPGQPDALFGYGASADSPVVGHWADSEDNGGGTDGDDAGDGVGVWRSWP